MENLISAIKEMARKRGIAVMGMFTIVYRAAVEAEMWQTVDDLKDLEGLL